MGSTAKNLVANGSPLIGDLVWLYAGCCHCRYVTKMSPLWKPKSAPATQVCTLTYTNCTPNQARWIERSISSAFILQTMPYLYCPNIFLIFHLLNIFMRFFLWVFAETHFVFRGSIQVAKIYLDSSSFFKLWDYWFTIALPAQQNTTCSVY